MIERKEAVRLIEELSRFYLSGDVSGRAYARVVEGVIALAGLEEEDAEFEDFVHVLATYSPAGGEGLVSDAELRRVVKQKLAGLP